MPFAGSQEPTANHDVRKPICKVQMAVPQVAEPLPPLYSEPAIDHIPCTRDPAADRSTRGGGAMVRRVALQVELAVLGAADEGLPLTQVEDQGGAVGVAGVADGDDAGEVVGALDVIVVAGRAAAPAP